MIIQIGTRQSDRRKQIKKERDRDRERKMCIWTDQHEILIWMIVNWKAYINQQKLQKILQITMIENTNWQNPISIEWMWLSCASLYRFFFTFHINFYQFLSHIISHSIWLCCCCSWCVVISFALLCHWFLVCFWNWNLYWCVVFFLLAFCRFFLFHCIRFADENCVILPINFTRSIH